MRHDEGAKENRWWPTEREKVGLLPEDVSSSRNIAGVLDYLRFAAGCYFHRQNNDAQESKILRFATPTPFFCNFKYLNSQMRYCAEKHSSLIVSLGQVLVRSLLTSEGTREMH
ncbi:hypothetical protein EAG_05324 [Camponotus floridanus]|uniref:Uncharacterized protein n=1 Tax=Camponotus floridanus TaxID=104421 RepID=E2A065_CAMFO|nr:hypothetical protein EAG_05324 [Camponotus floridanus]